MYRDIFRQVDYSNCFSDLCCVSTYWSQAFQPCGSTFFIVLKREGWLNNGASVIVVAETGQLFFKKDVSSHPTRVVSQLNNAVGLQINAY